jgi:hypothetical protein
LKTSQFQDKNGWSSDRRQGEILFFSRRNLGLTTAETAKREKTAACGKMPLAIKRNKYIRDAHGFATAIPQRC